jgi:hypothetical protein
MPALFRKRKADDDLIYPLTDDDGLDVLDERPFAFVLDHLQRSGDARFGGADGEADAFGTVVDAQDIHAFDV